MRCDAVGCNGRLSGSQYIRNRRNSRTRSVGKNSNSGSTRKSVDVEEQCHRLRSRSVPEISGRRIPVSHSSSRARIALAAEQLTSRLDDITKLPTPIAPRTAVDTPRKP